MTQQGIAWIEAHRTLHMTNAEFRENCDDLSRTVQARMEAHPCWARFVDFTRGSLTCSASDLLDLFMDIATPETDPPGKLMVYSGDQSRIDSEIFAIKNPEYAILETTGAGAMLFQAQIPLLAQQGRIPRNLWLAPGYIASAMLVAGARSDIYTFNNCHPADESTFRLWEVAYILRNGSVESFLHPANGKRTDKWEKAAEATGNLDKFSLKKNFRAAASPDTDGLRRDLQLSAERRDSYLFARRNLPAALL